MTSDQWSRHIKNNPPLAGATDALTLAGAALPLSGGIQINRNNQNCTIHLDPERHINDALPLSVDAGALPLAGAVIPLAVSICINGNYQHCAIRLYPVHKLHDLDGKHDAESIYYNKIMPSVASSIHCCQVRNKGELRNDAIWKQGDTWSSLLFNPLTQWWRVPQKKGQKDKNTYAVRTPINVRFCHVFSWNTLLKYIDKVYPPDKG